MKNSILSAPTYHFYRGGALLDSFSGAIPQKLMELLQKHKPDAGPARANWKLLALTGVLVAGVAAALRQSQRSALQALPAAAQSLVGEPAGPDAALLPRDERPDEEEEAPARQGPPAKAASTPSRGATHSNGHV